MHLWLRKRFYVLLANIIFSAGAMGQRTVSVGVDANCKGFSQETQVDILTTLKNVLVPAVNEIKHDCHHQKRDTPDSVPFPDLNSDDVNPRDSFKFPRDCADLYKGGKRVTGVYTVYTFAAALPVPIRVWCDMDTDNGGWMVFQRRMDGSVDFYRSWSDYRDGFGNVSGEYWLGNQLLHLITDNTEQELRVDLEDHEGETAYALYGVFHVASQKLKYGLTIGDYTGNAGNSLGGHNGLNFTTKDQDNDKHGSNCARLFRGAWWYGSCHGSNLNGEYRLTGSHNGTSYADIVTWSGWRGQRYSIKFTEMKIRPLNY